MTDNMNIKNDLFSKAPSPGAYENRVSGKPEKVENAVTWDLEDRSAIDFTRKPAKRELSAARDSDEPGATEPLAKSEPVSLEYKPPESGGAVISLSLGEESDPFFSASSMVPDSPLLSAAYNPGTLLMENTTALPEDIRQFAISGIDMREEARLSPAFFSRGINSIESVVSEGIYCMDGTRII